jgi:hypothetical protein
MRKNDDFWNLPATVDGRRHQAHPIGRDADDPEDFYDYVAAYRRNQRRRQVALIVLTGALMGLIIGLGMWIFAVVR